MSAIWRSAWFLALGRLSGGSGWTLHASASALLAEQGERAVLSEDLLQLALACLPSRLRPVALRSLLAVGLWVRSEGGYLLRQAPPEGQRIEVPPSSKQGAPSASPAAIRKRRERDRKRDNSEVSHVTSGVTSGVTERNMSRVTSGVTERDMSRVTSGVTSGVTERDIGCDTEFSPEETTSPSVTGGVTSGVTSSRACEPALAGGEFSSLSSLSSLSREFEKEREERRGEEISPPTPRSVTGDLRSLGAFGAVLAGIPQAPEQGPEGDPIELRTAEAAGLWAEATGRTVEALSPRDLSAIRVRVQERASVRDFRAAFAWAASEPWYAEGDRAWPRLVCGSRWEDCKRRGLRLLGGAPPSKSPGPPPAAAAAPAPRREPPETLPYGGPYAHPTRLRDYLGARYQPLPAEGIYLRQDLYLARQAGRKAAE